MKLKKLEIHNIASIEDAVIDFEAKPLAGSNVILITGETGSGKSTILDAICLSLYATTPRMNNTEMDGQWQENETDKMDITDTLQLVRKNTTEAYTRLWFLGSDGNDYEAEWHVERKKKNLDRTWALKNLTHPEASPQAGNGKGSTKDKEIKVAIQAAVGLTFEQFCRTTMLAQGEFTRFLKSGNKEKAAILEKITNTEQYAKIGAKVYDLTHHKYEIEMNAVDPDKQAKPLDPEKRKALAERQEDIGKLLAAFNKQRDTEQTKLTWLTTATSLLGDQKKAEETLKQAKNGIENDEYKAKLKNVNDWDSTTDPRAWLSSIQEATKDVNDAEHNLQQLQSEHITLLNGREFIRQRMNDVTEQIKEIDNEISAEGGEQAALEELRNQKEDVQTLIGDIVAAQSEVRSFFEKKHARDEKQKKLTELEKEIKEHDALLKDLRPKVKKAEEEYNKCNEDYERMNLAVNTLAEKLRTNLRIGKKCPICGQDIVSLDTVPHEDELRKLVDEVRDKRDAAKNAFDGLEKQQSNCEIWLKQNTRTYNNELNAFNADQSLSQAQEATLRLIKQYNIEVLDEHTAEALEKAKKNANDRKESLDKKVKRAEKRDKLQQTLDDLTNNKDRLLTASIDELLDKLPQWKSLVPQKAVELPDILNKAQSLSNRVTAALTKKDTASNKQQNSRDSLDSFLEGHPEMTESRLEELIRLKKEIESMRQSIQEAKMRYDRSKGALETVNGQIEEHQKNKPEIAEDETVEQLKKAIDDLNSQIEPLAKESGAIGQQLKDDDELIKKTAELRKEYEKKKTVFEQWNKLDKLIGDAKGDKFRLIAQSYILANLVKAANVHMRTLTDRYTLHAVPGQDLIILIEDAYQGGVKRPASTISGGESFLVSLALALALSEIGQSLKVETLFIDEGFGTLSGEPLNKAIDTLESLHASNNRQVCAISHREEVKERIPVQIQVEQNPQSSSSTIRIEPSI